MRVAVADVMARATLERAVAETETAAWAARATAVEEMAWEVVAMVRVVAERAATGSLGVRWDRPGGPATREAVAVKVEAATEVVAGVTAEGVKVEAGTMGAGRA